MGLNVLPAFDVVVIESDFCGPWEVWVKRHLCIRIKIDLKPIQMGFTMKR